MTKIDGIEKVAYQPNDESPSISSRISAEMLDNDDSLCCMDAKFLSSNTNSISDMIVPQNIPPDPVQQTQTSVSNVIFGQY
jgi:hypothetical protein